MPARPKKHSNMGCEYHCSTGTSNLRFHCNVLVKITVNCADVNTRKEKN